ncbi:MAG: S9 family peptidase, partial [Chitinophagaceae bacterium]
MHNKWYSALLVILILGYNFTAVAQQKLQLSVEDIWASGKFSARSVSGVNWMRDGRYYSSLQPDEKNKTQDIVKYDVTTGQVVATLVEGENLVPQGKSAPIKFDEYEFTGDEKKILFSTETEPIYRHSTKANYYVYDLASKQLSELSKGGKQQYASISPDGSQVAFVGSGPQV